LLLLSDVMHRVILGSVVSCKLNAFKTGGTVRNFIKIIHQQTTVMLVVQQQQ